MRRISLIICLTLACVSAAGAQIIRPPTGDPTIAVYASVGLLQIETVFDGSSGSVWDFGSAMQLRASLEKRISPGATLGVAVAHASVPLRYIPISDTPDPATTCSTVSSCDASTDLTTIYLSFTASGSTGLHQILNLGLGVSMFDNFTEDGTGRSLAPLKGDKDFYLGFGYGFGYGFSNHFEISLVQDAGVILHQRTGLTGDRDSYHQILATRLGFRLAIGR